MFEDIYTSNNLGIVTFPIAIELRSILIILRKCHCINNILFTIRNLRFLPLTKVNLIHILQFQYISLSLWNVISYHKTDHVKIILTLLARKHSCHMTDSNICDGRSQAQKWNWNASLFFKNLIQIRNEEDNHVHQTLFHYSWSRKRSWSESTGLWFKLINSISLHLQSWRTAFVSILLIFKTA